MKEEQNDTGTRFSLWLVPDAKANDVLRDIIHRLSLEYQSPFFEPHITLASSSTHSYESMEAITKELATSWQPLELMLTEVTYTPTFYQSLMIRVPAKTGLLSVRKKVLKGLGVDNGHWIPHVSLLYKELEVEEKKNIINRIGDRFDLAFKPDKVYLMNTSGRPEKWSPMKLFPLPV